MNIKWIMLVCWTYLTPLASEGPEVETRGRFAANFALLIHLKMNKQINHKLTNKLDVLRIRGQLPNTSLVSMCQESQKQTNFSLSSLLPLSISKYACCSKRYFCQEVSLFPSDKKLTYNIWKFPQCSFINYIVIFEIFPLKMNILFYFKLHNSLV